MKYGDVVYKRGNIGIICQVAHDQEGNAVTVYTGQSIADVLAENEGAEVMSWNEVVPLILKAQEETYCRPWLEIDEDQFLEMLNVLPPMDWRREDGRELFRMCEMTCGNITGTYARIGDRYFYANRHTTSSHDDLYREIEEGMA